VIVGCLVLGGGVAVAAVARAGCPQWRVSAPPRSAMVADPATPPVADTAIPRRSAMVAGSATPSVTPPDDPATVRHRPPLALVTPPLADTATPDSTTGDGWWRATHVRPRHLTDCAATSCRQPQLCMRCLRGGSPAIDPLEQT